MMRPTDADDILFKLTLAMDFQEVYKDTELSLTKLTKLLGVDSSVLNEIIKSNYGYGFRKYLNEIRITKLMDKIQKGVLGPNIYKCMEMSGYSAYSGQSDPLSALQSDPPELSNFFGQE